VPLAVFAGCHSGSPLPQRLYLLLVELPRLLIPLQPSVQLPWPSAHLIRLAAAGPSQAAPPMVVVLRPQARWLALQRLLGSHPHWRRRRHLQWVLRCLWERWIPTGMSVRLQVVSSPAVLLLLLPPTLLRVPLFLASLLPAPQLLTP